MKSKIVFIGGMGNGKSSVGNLFAGKDHFKVCDDIYPCLDYVVNSYVSGDLIIFDTVGLNDKIATDVSNLQEMIKTFKKEKMNAIFIVLNGQICRFDEGMKQMIREICKLFMGKYIWKQIGIIFTRYGYDEEQHEEIKMRAKNFVKEVLKTAEEEYKEIIKNQDQNNKTCDPNEKIANTLKCFFVNAKRKKNGTYDSETLNEIQKIKNLIKDYPPIDKVQSKFIVKKEIKKDQIMNISNESIKVKEKGFLAGLKTLGSYTFGVINALDTPLYLLLAGTCKTIGLPFDDDSMINKIGDGYIEAIKTTPEFFNKIPEELNTKIVGSETHYDEFDVEFTYWSDKSITQRIFNVRHRVK